MIDSKTKKRRLIRGFHSAYRRMKWDEPSKALTKNISFEASDNKVHPEQNRVLSIYEALVIQSITDYDYQWTVKGKEVPRGHISQSIGESVPPKLIDHVARLIINISKSELPPT